MGSVSLQPAEFAKFATALALAKFVGRFSFSMSKLKDACIAVGIILVPMLLIVLQRETGSALVYLAFFFVLYREGMSGVFLFTGLCAVVYFIVGIRFGNDLMPDHITSIGLFSVLSLVIILAPVLMFIYGKQKEIAWHLIWIGVGSTVLAVLFSVFVIPFNIVYFQLAYCFGLFVYYLYMALWDRSWIYFLIGLFTLGSVAFLFSAD